MFYTERLMIRTLDLSCDLNMVTRMFNSQRDLYAITGDAPKPTSAASCKAKVEGLIKDSEQSGLPVFAVCLRPPEAQMPESLGPDDDLLLTSDGKARYPLVGILNIHQAGFSQTKKCVKFGIIFDQKHVGNGFGTELLIWACDYIFNTLDLHRFELDVRSNNIPAIKCYEKVGFLHEGVHRESYFHEGEWHDSMTMAMLQKDWRAKSRK